jgi:tRNA-dihydrouridine synthase
VLGNGDVFESWDALRMLRQTGCDGVVVGRGCLGRPWLFAELCAVLTGVQPPPPPTLGEVVDTMREHVRLLIEFFGEKNGLQQIRKFTGWYLKGFPRTKHLLPALHMVKTQAEFEALVADLPRDVPYPEVALRARRCKDGSTQVVSLPEGFLECRDQDICVADPDEMDGG